MDTGSKIYHIDKHKQLIPLNGNVVNFSCFFEVKSKDKKPFNITVVEQNDTKPKEYKLVENGYINGEIESDGQLKSYFLILKSQQPCECEVRVIVKPKEKEDGKQPHAPIIQQPLHNPIQQQPSQAPIIQQPSNVPPSHAPIIQQPLHDHIVQKEEVNSMFSMKYIICILIFLIMVYFIYKYVIKNKRSDSFELSTASNTSF